MRITVSTLALGAFGGAVLASGAVIPGIVICSLSALCARKDYKDTAIDYETMEAVRKANPELYRELLKKHGPCPK